MRLSKKEAIAQALIQCEVLPIKTVARNLADDYPEYFKDTEAARSSLRFQRGAAGEESRTDGKDVVHSSIGEGIAKLKRL